jgi:undecaprenyl-diphosphatase
MLADYSRACEHARLWLALAAVGAVADRAQRKDWLRSAVAAGAAEAASQGLKRVVRRERPRLASLPPLAETPSRYSLPSAHTAAAVAAAMSVPRHAARRGAWVAAVAMAASRPYLGVHYPSDVLAGAALGAATAFALASV